MRPEDAVAGAVVALGRALREAGVPAGVDEELVLCRALSVVDVRRRDRVYWAARACLVRSPEHVGRFDVLFARFWAGAPLAAPGAAGVEHGESDPRMPGPQHGGEGLPQFRMEGRSSQLVDGEPSRATREVPSAGTEDAEGRGEHPRRGVLAAYSPDEVLSRGEPFSYAEQELAALRRLAAELRTAAPERRTRRLRAARRRGRLDVRATLRASLRTDGEAVRPAWSAPGRAPRRVVLLCDVSGSMERWSRALLAGLEAVIGSGLKAEAFVFATRLTRITDALGGHDAVRALEQARVAVADWSGGTRIGDALAEFNAVWGRRGVARGAIVLVVSDGWDRGDPARLASQLGRVRLQARRLIWINPRPAELDGEPLAVGLRAALAHVDDYVAGVDPAAMSGLSRVLSGIGPGRPARPQRPVGSAA